MRTAGCVYILALIAASIFRAANRMLICVLLKIQMDDAAKSKCTVSIIGFRASDYYMTVIGRAMLSAGSFGRQGQF